MLWPHDLLIAGSENHVRMELERFIKSGATDLVVSEMCPDQESAERTAPLTSVAERTSRDDGGGSVVSTAATVRCHSELLRIRATIFLVHQPD